MHNVLAIAARELRSYFGTPIAYVFLIIFVVLSGVFTFYVGNLLGRGTADLQPFFNYLPWLYLVLIPAVSMRMWAEERKTGTIELLMTLPVAPWEAVTGKWLAGLLFIALALVCTFPLWITVNLLGDPDNGVIASGYLAAFLLAGVFLAIGSCMSALTKNQVIAFVLAVAACFVVLLCGTPIVLDTIRWAAPGAVAEAVASLSALIAFEPMTRGIVEATSLVYVVSMIVFWLFATQIAVSLKKAD